MKKGQGPADEQIAALALGNLWDESNLESFGCYSRSYP